jgi:hypothetical protein
MTIDKNYMAHRDPTLPPQREKRENVLEQASKLVDGPRQDNYGHPHDDFTRVATAAKALGIDPTSGPLHHALYMILVKLSRLVQTPRHFDSIIDIAGYARTYELVLDKEAKVKV